MLASVAVVGPTLKQYWVNASCLLGGLLHISIDLYKYDAVFPPAQKTQDSSTSSCICILGYSHVIPYIPAYSATPCIIRVKIWGLGLPEKRLPLCIIRPQILDVGSVPVDSVTGHLNVRHGYYLILINSPATPAWTMLNDGNSGNSTALQNQRAVPAYL